MYPSRRASVPGDTGFFAMLSRFHSIAINFSGCSPSKGVRAIGEGDFI